MALYANKYRMVVVLMGGTRAAVVYLYKQNMLNGNLYERDHANKAPKYIPKSGWFPPPSSIYMYFTHTHMHTYYVKNELYIHMHIKPAVYTFNAAYLL